MSTATPTSSQTVVASSVFLDLVGFSKLPTSAQVHAKELFTLALRTSLGELGTEHYWARDLGDGALIICPHSPEHALFLALRVHQAFQSGVTPSSQPGLQLRIGLNLGVVKTSPDLEGRSNYLGDGINSTQRVMDFAQPGQILASRAFVDAVEYLHADYAVMFGNASSKADKHGRTHEVREVSAPAATLVRLKKDLERSIPATAPTAPWAPSHSTAESNRTPTPPQDFVQHTLSIVRDWFIPVNALLFSVGIVWAGFERFGLSSSATQGVGVVIAVAGFATWWFIKHKSPRFGAIGFILAAMGCMVAVTGWLTHATVEATAKPHSSSDTAASTTVQVKTPPTEAPSTALAIQAASSAPQATVTAERKKTAPAAPAVTKAPIAVESSPSGAGNHTRCTVLLNKSALGERISAAEKQELLQSCR
jgi:class 3 adenylate cyclase